MIGSFEENNPAIALNILYTKEKEILPAYFPKHNLTCKKTNNSFNDSKRRKRGWHYLAVKKLSALLHKTLLNS